MALRRRLAPIAAGMLVALTSPATAQGEFATDAEQLAPAIQL